MKLAIMIIVFLGNNNKVACIYVFKIMMLVRNEITKVGYLYNFIGPNG